jgi:serine phosphatase RsbU (regulator of sigma subunit)
VNTRLDAKLLIVDDIPENRDLLSRRLRRLGYTDLTSANDGVEALEALASQPFDVVLLDVMMPRLNGIDVLRRLHDERRLERTAVIMISAATEMETVVQCIELGAEDYLPKPFNAVLLQARLGSVIDKMLLRAESRAHLERLERELAEARRQQLRMVPHEFPVPSDTMPVSVHAVMYPAREVGGDLYDVFEAAPGTLCVALGDVSGKGVPAALFMARTRSLLRAATLQFVAITGTIPTPAAIASVINDELCKDNPDTMFVTLFFGLFDVGTGHLRFVNAGHVHPYLLGADRSIAIVELTSGPPLGVSDLASFREFDLILAPGDGLIVISDGLPEMMNGDGAYYTLERLEEDFKELYDPEPAPFIGRLVERLMAFSGAVPQADDVTALVLRRMT